MTADRATRFDPAQAPLLRWMLVTTGPQSRRLVLTSHHLLLDGWSTPLLLRELLLLYATDGDGAMLPRVDSYRDFLAWIAGQDTTGSLEPGLTRSTASTSRRWWRRPTWAVDTRNHATCSAS